MTSTPRPPAPFGSVPSAGSVPAGPASASEPTPGRAGAADPDEVRARAAAWQPRRAAVLGSPVSHSLSPVLHRAAYAALGLEWRYDAYRVDEHELPGFLERLFPTWAGLSLTMPLKRAVIPLLDEVSPLARAVRAVNTVLLDPYGPVPRRGENTDVPGMVAALRERGVGTPARCSVLGGGATAASAVAALAQLGAVEVEVYVRDPRRAGLEELADRLGVRVRALLWERAAEALDAPLLVATTPAGVTDALAGDLTRRAGSPGTDPAGVLFEVLYEPWPTPLARAWSATGGTVLSGLDLLVHQAALQVELMTGQGPAPVAAMRAAGERALAARGPARPGTGR